MWSRVSAYRVLSDQAAHVVSLATGDLEPVVPRGLGRKHCIVSSSGPGSRWLVSGVLRNVPDHHRTPPHTAIISMDPGTLQLASVTGPVVSCLR